MPKNTSDDFSLSEAFRHLAPRILAVHQWGNDYHSAMHDVTDEDITKVFEQYGKVDNTQIWLSKHGGPWAFVTFARAGDASRAMRGLDREMVNIKTDDGRRIVWKQRLGVVPPRTNALHTNYDRIVARRLAGKFLDLEPGSDAESTVAGSQTHVEAASLSPHVASAESPATVTSSTFHSEATKRPSTPTGPRALRNSTQKQVDSPVKRSPQQTRRRSPSPSHSLDTLKPPPEDITPNPHPPPTRGSIQIFGAALSQLDGHLFPQPQDKPGASEIFKRCGFEEPEKTVPTQTEEQVMPSSTFPRDTTLGKLRRASLGQRPTESLPLERSRDEPAEKRSTLEVKEITSRPSLDRARDDVRSDTVRRYTLDLQEDGELPGPVSKTQERGRNSSVDKPRKTDSMEVDPPRSSSKSWSRDGDKETIKNRPASVDARRDDPYSKSYPYVFDKDEDHQKRRRAEEPEPSSRRYEDKERSSKRKRDTADYDSDEVYRLRKKLKELEYDLHRADEKLDLVRLDMAKRCTFLQDTNNNLRAELDRSRERKAELQVKFDAERKEKERLQQELQTAALVPALMDAAIAVEAITARALARYKQQQQS